MELQSNALHCNAMLQHGMGLTGAGMAVRQRFADLHCNDGFYKGEVPVSYGSGSTQSFAGEEH